MRPLLALLTVLAAAVTVPGAAAPAGGRVVDVRFNATLKKTILVDGRGRTLYAFTEDKGMRGPQCVGTRIAGTACAREFPPMLGPAAAGAGVKASLLGTEKRADGKVQATYAGWPLYGYAGSSEDGPGDGKPGDLHGQSLYDQWYVLTPAGRLVTTSMHH